jgi:hypothetical protein
MPRTCHEYVTCLWDGAAFSQQLEKVPELAVDITTYRDRTRDGLNIGFFHEDGSDAIAKYLHVRFGKVLAAHELFNPFFRDVAGHSVSV